MLNSAVKKYNEKYVLYYCTFRIFVKIIKALMMKLFFIKLGFAVGMSKKVTILLLNYNRYVL